MVSFDVIGCGALNWDCLFRVERVVMDSESLILESFEAPGGSAANTIHALAKWGLKTGFIGAVGADPQGQHILSAFREVGTETKRIRILEGEKTGRVIGFADQKGHRSLYIDPGANLHLRLNEDDIAYASIARCIHLSSLIGSEVFESQRRFVKALPGDAIVSFAPGALYARQGLEALKEILHRTTILFVTHEELATLMGTENLDAAVHTLWNLGVQVIAVTLGEQGSWVTSPRDSHYAPSHQAHIVDTTGAGDAFAAGFLWGFLNGRPLPECQRLGMIAASFCLRALGARTGTPTLEELLAVAFE